MDVQAAAVPAPPPRPAQPPAAPQPPAPDASTVTASSPAPTAPAASPGTTTTTTAPHAPASNQPTDDTLSPVVAKLFNAAEANVEVSFQVLHNPDEVVTVFTDKATGKEIVQFPSQALIALAEMYDKDAGNVLDKSV
jgi:uncharacterized FlaG/YvyC family protein